MNADDFDPDRFLAEVFEKAGKKSVIQRVLDLPSSRIAELYKPAGQGQRKLTMKEGLKLAEHFGLWPCDRISAERLIPILRVALRYPPKGGWTDQGIERLAQEIVFGLGLQRELQPEAPLPPDPLPNGPPKVVQLPHKRG